MKVLASHLNVLISELQYCFLFLVSCFSSDCHNFWPIVVVLASDLVFLLSDFVYIVWNVLTAWLPKCLTCMTFIWPGFPCVCQVFLVFDLDFFLNDLVVRVSTGCTCVWPCCPCVWQVSLSLSRTLLPLCLTWFSFYLPGWPSIWPGCPTVCPCVWPSCPCVCSLYCVHVSELVILVIILFESDRVDFISDLVVFVSDLVVFVS